MKPDVKTYRDNQAVAHAFAEEFSMLVTSCLKTQRVLNIVLSGGTTPSLFFSILAEQYADKIEWERLHFFWADERCVTPTDDESNFGEADGLLFSKIKIPTINLHRVRGERDPADERTCYENEILDLVTLDDSGRPVFDMVLLGMGADGHTASLFPGQFELLNSNRICEIASHPDSGQKRITLTLPVLNAGQHVFFLVTGESKADVLSSIFNRTTGYLSYPAALVEPRSGVTFFIDKAADSNRCH